MIHYVYNTIHAMTDIIMPCQLHYHYDMYYVYIQYYSCCDTDIIMLCQLCYQYRDMHYVYNTIPAVAQT